MTAATEPGIAAHTLVELVGEVFSGLFGEDRGRPYEDDADVPLPVTAHVRVTGGWHCTVRVACSDGLATTAAAELFGIAPTDVIDADRCDVVGELANIVGGNAKSMMPGPSVLSLPEAGITGLPRPVEPGALSVRLTWCRQSLQITVTNPHSKEPS